MKKVEIYLHVLQRAERLLEELRLEHDRGTKWVELDTAPAAAVGALKKLDMIRVIKFNDGVTYGQLRGVA